MPAVTTDNMVPRDDDLPTAEEEAIRLPSNRPLDHRWDRSRGIVFATTRRSLDLTWTPSKGVTFSTPQAQSRSYSARRLGSSAPPSRSANPVAQSTKDSLYDNPHRAPPVLLSSHNEKIAALRDEISSLTTQREELIAAAWARAGTEALQQARFERLERERLRDQSAAQRRIKQYEQDMADERRNNENRMSAARSQMHLSSAATVRKATDLEQYVKQLQQEMQYSDEEHARKLAGERQALQRQHNDEVQLLTRERKLRESERQTYSRYRKVWFELDDSSALFHRPIRDIEEIYYRAMKRAEFQPAYSSRIDQINPLLRRTQAQLFERLDASLRESAERARDSGQALKTLRLEQRDVINVLKGFGHDSRALTRSLRISNPSKSSAAGVAYYMANEKPFRERRDRLDKDIASLKLRIASKGNKVTALRDTKELMDLQEARKVVTNLAFAHTLLRDTEIFRALLTDNIVAKEVFVTTETANGMLIKVVREWNEINEDDNTAACIEQSVRSTYMDDIAGLREKLRHFEGLVRKRAVLQQQLGQIPVRREAELDTVIRERLTLKRVAERTVFDKLTFSGRPSSFARSSSAPASRTLELSKSEDVEDEAPAEPRTRRLARRRSVPSRARSLPAASTSVTPNLEREKEAAALLRKLKAHLQTLGSGPEYDGILIEQAALRKEYHALQLSRTEKNKVTHINAVRRGKVEVAKINPNGLDSASSDQPKIRWVEGRRCLVKVDGDVFQPNKAAVGSTTSKAPTPSTLNLRPTATLQAALAFGTAGSRGFHGTTEAWSGVGQESMNRSSQLRESHDVFLAPAAGDGNRTNAGRREGDYRTDSPATPSTKSQSLSSPSLISAARQQSLPIGHDLEPASDLDPMADSLEAPMPCADPHRTPSNANMSGPAEPSAPSPNESSTPKQDSITTMTYRIPVADYREAVKASLNTSAAYWSYHMYKNAAGDAPTVHYCTKLDQAERVLQQHFLGQPVLGFDIEWEQRARKESAAKQNVSLIQIACEDRICLIHVAIFAGTSIEHLVPATLREILESNQIVKAGVNIGGDARRMRDYLGVNMRAQFELCPLFKLVTFARQDVNWTMKGAGLAAQVQAVLLLPMLKGDVRTSSWSRKLSKEQADYSASDAYAGFQLFHALEAKRLKMDPMPPRPAFRELEMPLVFGDGTVLPTPGRRPTRAHAEGEAVADEVDEEAEEVFFDAVETLDAYELGGHTKARAVTASGGAVTYPALPAFDPKTAVTPESFPAPNDVATGSTTTTGSQFSDQGNSTALSALAIFHQAASERRTASIELYRAKDWLATFKAEHPTTQATDPGLLAYHIWHFQRHDVPRTATLLAHTPLAQTTVASLILEALRREEVLVREVLLEFRLREVLEVLPQAVWGRYEGVLASQRAHSERREERLQAASAEAMRESLRRVPMSRWRDWKHGSGGEWE
ncbi:hypothetical protein LTR02_005511 [Friedmanniomyces endolithicus]|nr:hypothetical protein LTR94_006792 [Friedmanniomyces endolithicus]KAK0792495.1 hypothetical protein LTR59_008496 [Friedmanniomyces endolithicus]KAK0803938.1 hypothetical protein LTR38_005996 [Friedmanniomyces endolithicus]KAK0836960.1 hypothetical protein LTR03_013189 [Friedmanniomyces endolithicus]KAK0861146.1 hypothetical protein LTS02_008020 [Friedmanniomyces endolithicus]